ncbi:MAG: TIGR00725 family protein [bacterium]
MKNNKKLQIGVVGYAGPSEYPVGAIKNKGIYKIAEKVGFLLARNGAIVVTGGKGGVMESAAYGARKAKGLTVGVIKGKERYASNKFTDVEILSGMVSDGFDEFLLVNMCDAIIVIGGGAGTLEEITIAYRNKKPIIVLKNTGGWADNVCGIDLDQRKTINVQVVSTPEEAVNLAIKSAKKQ